LQSNIGNNEMASGNNGGGAEGVNAENWTETYEKDKDPDEAEERKDVWRRKRRRDAGRGRVGAVLGGATLF
jgi:hypothetical protein